MLCQHYVPNMVGPLRLYLPSGEGCASSILEPAAPSHFAREIGERESCFGGPALNEMCPDSNQNDAVPEIKAALPQTPNEIYLS